MTLWTSAEAADHLRLKGAKRARTAKRLLLDMGVLPIPLGRGRSLGDRWRPQEVEAALDKLRGKIAQPEPRCAPYVSIVGRDIKEVVRELTSPATRQ
jgi:hypothetical protein